MKRESRITKQELSEYEKNIKAITEILSGKKTNLAKKLEREMGTLAKRGKLEDAIKLRNHLARLNRVFENAQINKESRITNQESSNNTLEQLRQTLNLPDLPHRIEAYDVSNIQGDFAVGVMIVFTDGQPDKNQYRKFKLGPASALSSSSVAKGDPAMLAEMLTRRFKHMKSASHSEALAKEWPQPDLILVDGGKAQLGAARAAISNFEFLISKKIPIIALTKDDRHRGSHIYGSQFSGPTSLASLATPVKNLILNLDSEAHRFAINYYRTSHRNSIKK